MLLAGAAGWVTPHLFSIRSFVTRVVILSTGLTLWFSVFEALSAISLKRKFSPARVVLVFGANILFFSLTEVFLARVPLPALIPVAITVFVIVAMIILFRRLR